MRLRAPLSSGLAMEPLSPGKDLVEAAVPINEPRDRAQIVRGVRTTVMLVDALHGGCITGCVGIHHASG